MKTKSILSSDALCLSETYLTKINSDSSQQVYECFLISPYSMPVNRRFYLVNIKGISYWANAVTGTLFISNGKCMTSNLLSLKQVPTPAGKQAYKKEIENVKIAA